MGPPPSDSTYGGRRFKSCRLGILPKTAQHAGPQGEVSALGP